MTTTVEVPVWILSIVCVLAAWAALERLLLPSVRWYFRRRINRIIDEVNTRLSLQVRPFSLTKRQVLIDRLTYDPAVVAAADEYAAAEGMPRQVAFAHVERYAREIVPAFNAYLYFRIGYWLARRVAELLYRVRLGYVDQKALAAVDREATVVFVINHRSNMDYVLVAYLAMNQVALSYAVGEWARIWPLQQLIRAMGAFFVRRNSQNALYRRVLERYVQMATEGGVTQAVFLEGGLSRDGRLREPRLGLLDYMIRNFDVAEGRDIVFLPVAINYDRVLEDRTLLRGQDGEAEPVGTGHALLTTLRFVGRQFGLMLLRRWHRFGYACVNFGTPLSLRAWLSDNAIDLQELPRDQRFSMARALAQHLMDRVAAVVPVLPVSLVASAFHAAGTVPIDRLQLKAMCNDLRHELQQTGAHVYLPRGEEDYAIEVGLRMLRLRRLVLELPDGRYVANEAEMALLAYYANAIAHFFRDGVAGGDLSRRISPS